MARRTTLTSLRQISEINLTPLMDLTFILLITFIITFPLIEQGVPVNLPKGAAEDMDPGKMLKLTIQADGGLYLDELAFSREELEAELTQLGAVEPLPTILVRADKEVKYEEVMDVILMMKRAKLTKMALVTEAAGQ